MTEDTNEQPKLGSSKLEAARAMARYKGLKGVPDEGPLPDEIWDQVKVGLGE